MRAFFMPTVEGAHAWYPTTDPVHGFDHILRVYHLAEKIALAEGADPEIVAAAALLHDATPPAKDNDPEPGASDEKRTNHQIDRAAFARQVLAAEGWSEERICAVARRFFWSTGCRN